MNKWIFVATLSAVAVGAGAWAKGRMLEVPIAKEQLGLMLDAHTASAADVADAKYQKRLAAQTARETRLQVGDPDSFGRSLRWLGVLGQGGIHMDDCTPLEGESPDPFCMHVDAASTSTQFAEFRDMGHITLPAHSMNSLLCHWLSPTVSATFANLSQNNNRVARLVVSPSFTVENVVLNDPRLRDPDTGLPLGGKIEVFVSSSRMSAVLDRGESLPQYLNSSRTCVGGYVTRETLQSFYGLSRAQAARFFKEPTTVRLNLQVSADHVQDGSIIYSVRFVGD